MEKNTIYAIVRIDNWAVKHEERGAVHTYNYQTSNKDKMIEKFNTYKEKYPSYRWYLVSRERAHEIERQYRQRLKDLEKARLDKCEKNLNRLMTNMIYSESIQRKK